MKKLLCLVAGLSIIGGFCSGCGEKKEEAVKTTTSTEASKQEDTENWEPEMIKSPDSQGDHGHAHGPDGHGH